MNWIAYITLAIIGLMLAAYLFIGLYVGSPAWGIGLGMVFLLQWVARRFYKQNYSNPEVPTSYVTGSILASVLIGALLAFLILLLFHEQGWGFDSSGEFVLISIMATVAFITGSVLISGEFRRKLEASLQEQPESAGRSSAPKTYSQIEVQRREDQKAGLKPFRVRERTTEEQTMGSKIMCPYCLDIDTVGLKADNNTQHFACLSCNMRIPLEYVSNPGTQREVMSAVGFRGHGKTTYFASLFNALNDLANFWSGFYTFAVDEKSLDTVRENTKLLKTGELPAATPTNFPAPTVVKFSNMPGLGNRFFLFYDTSGEAYAKASALIRHASFVRRSRTVIFILSLDDLEREGQKMHELLSTYIQGLTELKGNPKDQHLIVVLSKADRLKARLENREDIWHYLEEGRLERLGDTKLGNYMKEMRRISLSIRGFVRNVLGEAQFLNFAEDRFKSVEFSIVSALGAEPAGNRLQVEVTPKRIMDPLLWATYKSLGLFQKVSI